MFERKKLAMEMDKSKKGSKVDYLIIFVLVSAVLLIGLLTYSSTRYMSYYKGIVQESIEKRLIIESKIIESMVDIDELQEYLTETDMDKESYKELRLNLQNYVQESDLVYISLMRINGGQLQYIMDSNSDPENSRGLLNFEDANSLIVNAYNGETVVSLIGNYQYGKEGLISVYVPIFDNQENVVALIGIDVSDRKIVEGETESKQLTYISIVAVFVLGMSSYLIISRYRKKAKDYNEASIAKGQFLSRMSHEIRTPMNAIIGMCRMAKKAEDPVKKAEYLDNISSSSDYLLELINDILDFSKIEARKMTLNAETFSIYKMMEKIEIILSSQVVAKDQTFSIELANDLPKYLSGDQTRLTQIIINLTGNALKFTSEKGKIDISVSLVETKDNLCNIQFVVKDNGIGMADKQLLKLFEAFEQGDGTITRKFGGTGLGLTISKMFIEMMDGTISVTSKVNEGSTFRFNVWLDIVSEEELPTDNHENKIDSDGTVDCTGLTFLVAEDNKVNQIIVKNIMEDFGAVVEFANDGAECVEMFTQNPDKYRIIFMDIQMPDVDGLEATRRIRASSVHNAKTIPIIAMTAEVFQEDINNALNAGMDEHLGKPLNINDIVMVIKEILNRDRR